MRKTSWIWVCVLSLALISVACEEDPKETAKDATGTDTGGGTDATDATGTDTGGTDTTPGTDTNRDLDWSTYDAAAGQASYLSRLIVPEVVNGEPECCVDYGDISANGSGAIDNAFANLAGTLGGFGLDLPSVLDTSVAGCALNADGSLNCATCAADADCDGSAGSCAGGTCVPEAPALVLLFDHWNLDGADDDDFTLVGILGDFEGSTTYAEASGGTGTFTGDAASFDTDGSPFIFFDPSKMTAGALASPPGTFVLPIPLGTVNLEVPILNTEITGDATIGSTGVSYANGTLAGYIAVDSFFEAFNSIAADSCACLGTTGNPADKTDVGNLFYFDATTGQWGSNCPPDISVCSDTICQTIGGSDIGSAQLCGLAGTLIPGLADIDLDGDTDNGYEAVTIGLGWTAAEADITAIQ